MIPLLAETDDLLVVDKPLDIATIPERDPTQPSVLQMLEEERGEKLFVVHRLDKAVSGVLLFARTAEMHRYLNQQFADRKVRKQYIALCHGEIRHRKGQCDAPIRRFGSGRMGVDEQRGKPSMTTYHVLDAMREYSLLSLHPRTGRRHQLRVHTYHFGHPIVGDLLYGEPALQRGYPRLFLHAYSLSYYDAENTQHRFTSPIPDDFTQITDAVGIGFPYDF